MMSDPNSEFDRLSETSRLDQSNSHDDDISLSWAHSEFTNQQQIGSHDVSRYQAGPYGSQNMPISDKSENRGSYEYPEYALLSYARTNNFDLLQQLLDSKLRGEIELCLNFKGQEKQNFSWTALHLACYFGNLDTVEILLSRKEFLDEIDINIQNNSGDTPLHKATLTNRGQIVQKLLSHDANVFIKNCDGLLAKQLTNDRHVMNMLEAAEQVDKNRIVQAMFKAVDNGDLKKLQEYFTNYDIRIEAFKDEFENSSGSQNSNFNASLNPEPQVSDENQAKNEVISRLTDERGNTLLHVSAMRGFKAICIYLLEQGFDPYKKNHIGQSPIDLSSYQLRQLFTTVRPAAAHLKKLSSPRVSRFEGPLLRKVRILGWRQIYVRLENGVLLLFNNRQDSMNKSRRGYKYLESAACEPEAGDVGSFTVYFSDKSRATFLLSTDHLTSYASYKSSLLDQDKNLSTTNQIELIRQKWIDSIRDHIRYSTEFIKNGLKFNDCEDEAHESNITSLNHLLPVDTIKSFIQEAHAHYSILSRHSDELGGLIKTVLNTNQVKSTMGSYSEDDLSNEVPAQLTNSVASSTSTSNRLLNFIRPNRASRNLSGNESALSQQSSSTRRVSDTLTKEFLQDDWHCILFHLRLLLESAENTKISMGQALSLVEHQEQLRQNKIQDQEERCRVLEDSLHSLARDHHELEKSISMSQIYHSAATAARSISMSISTDLNEYYDAFEDFDEANSRTLTPSSMPDEANLDEQVKFTVNEEEGSAFGDGDDDDDLRSNCSALTIATTSGISVITQQRRDETLCAVADETGRSDDQRYHRTRLPSPMVPRDQVSIWSILKNCIGKDLSKITMPVVFNEPLTMLQRACEGVQYTRYLKMADDCDDPVERMELICTFIIAGLSANCHRIIKPFNPLLYETYEYDHELDDGSHVKTMSQQVSHHPPITAAYAESENFLYNLSVNPKIKFWGRSVEVQPDGQCRIYLKRRNETYLFKSVTCSVHNIIVGKLWFEHRGPLDIKCVETNMEAKLDFKKAGWFSNDLHRFDGTILKGTEKFRYVYGKWSNYIKTVDYSDYENYLKDNQQKLFKIPDSPDERSFSASSSVDQQSSRSINNNFVPNSEPHGDASNSSPKNESKAPGKKKGYAKSESSTSLDIPNSRTIWRLESQYLSEYYNFSLFTMKLNELPPELESTLPRTDSRFRPDVRKLEEGDLDGAANEKDRLEQKQRDARSKDKRFREPSSDFLWFDLKEDNASGEKFWIYKGEYWENRRNPERFADLF